MELSRKERWILSNQFLILEALYPRQANEYKVIREIVEQGYELHYEEISANISDDEEVMTSTQCELVIDILDMFAALKRSYDSLSNKSGIDTTSLEFAGFDGNNETTYMAYAEFLVERQGKFKNIYQSKHIDKFNSHIRMLDHYRNMLAAWKKSKNQYQLTRDDIIRITSV